LVLVGFLKNRSPDPWVMIFLVTTILTSATGFLFPFEKLLPSHIVGIISLVVLAVALVARYSMKLAGRWRAVYVITSVVALYFNVFVLVVQSFLKVGPLHALAPNGNEPPFAVAQLIVLAAFGYLGFKSVKKFRGGAVSSAAR
jgi:hypothetical protein